MTKIRVADLSPTKHKHWVLHIPADVEIMTHQDEDLQNKRAERMEREYYVNNVIPGTQPGWRRIIIGGFHFVEVPEDSVVEVTPPEAE